MLSRFFSFSTASCRLALARGAKKWAHLFNLPLPAASVASLPHQPHLSYCSSSTIAALRCNNNSYGDCSGSFFRGKLAPIKLPFLDSVTSRCTPSSAVVAAASVSTAAASYGGCSWCGNGGAGGDGQDGDAKSPSSSQSGSSSSSSGADNGPPQEQYKWTFFATVKLFLRRRRGLYRYKYRRAYTPGDVSFSPFSFYLVYTLGLVLLVVTYFSDFRK